LISPIKSTSYSKTTLTTLFYALSLHDALPIYVKEILIAENAEEVGGIMHSYSGLIEDIQTYADMNFYFSLAGIVTFKNAPEIREIAKEIPLNRLLIETDSPFLTPHPY